MTKFILPIVLCISAAAASAAQPSQLPQLPPNVPEPVQEAQAQIVQAALVLPAGAQPMRAPAAPTAAQEDAGQGSEDGDRQPTLMLLAALALMIGIALRRWSMGSQ